MKLASIFFAASEKYLLGAAIKIRKYKHYLYVIKGKVYKKCKCLCKSFRCNYFAAQWIVT